MTRSDAELSRALSLGVGTAGPAARPAAGGERVGSGPGRPARLLSSERGRWRRLPGAGPASLGAGASLPTRPASGSPAPDARRVSRCFSRGRWVWGVGICPLSDPRRNSDSSL